MENSVSSLSANRPPRQTSSKYDFVKVRVWLGDNSDHYYVLSRFLVSRMLTVTKIPSHVAIKIALELKKLLIDNSLLDVSQSDLEANLFKLMERRGYGAEYINRYKMMTRFHHQRIPLIILVCGAACVGKSTIATQLAQRLNLPNVLQTDMVYELLRTATDAPLAATPVWSRDFSSPEELITEFRRECRIVRKGLHGDLSKAMKDGKPVIIEGVHLDPSLYLVDENNGRDKATDKEARLGPLDSTASPGKTLSNISEPDTAQPARALGNSELGTTHALKALVENGNSELGTTHALKALVENGNSELGATHALKALVENGNSDHISPALRGVSSEHKESNTAEVKGSSPMLADDGACSSTGDNGPSSSVGMQEGMDPQKHDDAEHIPSLKPPTKAIVVPIILRMADTDHQTLLEEWIACRSVDGTETLEEKAALVKKLRVIQDYLCSFTSQGMKVVDISATSFPQTLDWLHSYLLQCIESGCELPSPGAGS
ncbi:unnamed protein product [Calypogeia fissa]